MTGKQRAPSPELAATMQQLRSLVHDCLAKHMYDSAIFFADKLVSMSGQAPAEVYTLAQGFYCRGQHRRCLHLLRSTQLIDKDVRIRYLASRCMLACGELEECLELLGGEAASNPSELSLGALPPAVPGTINYLSVTCLMRGRVFDAQENLAKATAWYRHALQTDPFNYEAYEALVGLRRLAPGEEAQLLAGLDIPPGQEWLRLLYQSATRTGGVETEAALATLEAPATAPAPPPRREAAETPTLARAAPPPGPETDGRVRGWGLAEDADVAAARAEWLCRRGRFAESWALTQSALARDPYALQCLPWHCAAGVRLRKKQDLFLLAHRVMDAHEQSGTAWYAVGCYYLATESRGAEAATRAFARATRADRGCSPAWLGLAAALTASGEAEAALQAYRSASRLFPGLHEPLLGMARAYASMNVMPLAEQVLSQAHEIAPHDLAVCNELGALAFRQRRFEEAAGWFRTAVSLLPDGGAMAARSAGAVAILVNLGHSLRKLGQLEEAASTLERAVALSGGGDASAHGALAFTLHLAGRLPEAVEQYHVTLSLAPGDAFAADMLAIAVEEDVELFMETVEEEYADPGGDGMASPVALF